MVNIEMIFMQKVISEDQNVSNVIVLSRCILSNYKCFEIYVNSSKLRKNILSPLGELEPPTLR